MNKTRYSSTEFGRNKPMNFRPSGTLKFLVEACLVHQISSILKIQGKEFFEVIFDCWRSF